jgi:hypothetical protein
MLRAPDRAKGQTLWTPFPLRRLYFERLMSHLRLMLMFGNIFCATGIFSRNKDRLQNRVPITC